MRAALPLMFPSSRTLAGWWSQLAPLRPRVLWTGHLFLHHVEALVRTTHPVSLDQFSGLVLQGLRLDSPASLTVLEQRLSLERPILGGVLTSLAREGLAAADEAGCWSLTQAGCSVCATRSYRRTDYVRRVFHFRDSLSLGGCPSQYVSLGAVSCTPCPAPEGWTFNPNLLQACVAQTPEWKSQHGFPLEIEELVRLADVAPAALPEDIPRTAALPSAWRRVIIDRSERLILVLALVPGDLEKEREQLVGFAVDPPNWVLRTSDPVLSLGAVWHEVFPELQAEVPEEQWRDAWRAWCQPRSLPPREVEACSLHREGHRLRVTAPSGFLQRLRAARSDALRGDAWLLGGRGPVRPAACVELVEVTGIRSQGSGIRSQGSGEEGTCSPGL